MSTTTHGIILLVIAGMEIMLMLYLLMSRSNGHIKYSYAGFMASVALWVMGNGIYYLSGSNEARIFWIKVSHVAAMTIMVFLVYFSFAYPYLKSRIKKSFAFLAAGIVLFFIGIIFFSNGIIEGVTIRDGVLNEVVGKMFWLYCTVLLALYFFALYKLLQKYRIADGAQKSHLRVLLIGIIGSGIIGTIFNLFMPWFGGPQLFYFGTEGSVIMLGITTYIVFKK